MRGFRRIQGKFFSLSFGALPARSAPGGACVVSSKAVARAVARNKVKRRCRSVLLPLLSQVRGPAAFVLYAKKGAAEAPFRDVRDDIISLFNKAAPAFA